VTETNVFQLFQPGTFADPLTEVLRNGARALLAQAVQAEVSSLLSCHADKLTDDGRRRLVRHVRSSGIGPVAVRCPRVRDRGGAGCERIRFSLAILPPYARRSKSLEVLIPILYLKGVSTGDFGAALIALCARTDCGQSQQTASSLDNFICGGEQRRRHGEVERLGSHEIDELRRLHDRQVSGLLPFQA